MSILYAKPEPLRTSKNRQDRQSLNQKAHSTVTPMFIFQSPTYIRSCFDLSPREYPSFFDVPSGNTTAVYKDTPSAIGSFMKDKTFTPYFSNFKDDGFKTLHQPNLVHLTTKMDYFSSIGRLLAEAQKKLPQEHFQEAFKQLVKIYWLDSDFLTADMGEMRLVGSSRYRFSSRLQCNGSLTTSSLDPTTLLLRSGNRCSSAKTGSHPSLSLASPATQLAMGHAALPLGAKSTILRPNVGAKPPS